jgi:hypothetical protein
MTDSPDTTNPSARSAGARSGPLHEDAELIALGGQLDALVIEFHKSAKAWDAVEQARRRVLLALPESPSGEERYDLAEREVPDPVGIRHTDDISNSMNNVWLKIMGLPAFTIAGPGVKARLAAFSCEHFYDKDDDLAEWDHLGARQLIDAVLKLAKKTEGREQGARDLAEAMARNAEAGAE